MLVTVEPLLLEQDGHIGLCLLPGLEHLLLKQDGLAGLFLLPDLDHQGLGHDGHAGLLLLPVLGLGHLSLWLEVHAGHVLTAVYCNLLSSGDC